MIIILQINHLTIRSKSDDRILLDDFSLTINSHDKIAIIGEEGNGKSTLLKWMYDPLLIRDYTEYEGTRDMHHEVLAYLPQELPKSEQKQSVYEYLYMKDAFEKDVMPYLYKAANRLGLDQNLLFSSQTMNALSGGEKIKVQLALILAFRPTIIFLDEPGNDLDLSTLQFLESFMKNTECTIVFVSHDEQLIEHTATRMIHLEQLKRKTEARYTISNLPYREYIENRTQAFLHQNQIAFDQRRQNQIRMEKFRQIQQKVEHDQNTITRADAHGGRLLKKKMHAVKSMERRFEKQRENMTDFALQEEAIMIHFLQDISVPKQKQILQLSMDQLLTPDNTCLSQHIELNVTGPQKICIIGNNGCGKSTLLKHISSLLLKRNDITAAYMPQNYEDILSIDQTPVEYLVPDKDPEKITRARQYLGAMRYTSDEMMHSVSALSGGQKAKIFFLKMILDQANVLILDEPTRNFSPLSQPVIYEILKDYHGTIISVSHDRNYIAQVIDTIYVLDKNGLTKQSTHD